MNRTKSKKKLSADAKLKKYMYFFSLCKALCNGNVTSAKEILKNDVPINQKDNLGRTPVHIIMKHARIPYIFDELLDLLIEKGADVNIEKSMKIFGCFYEETPLLLAVKTGNYLAAKKLLEVGADPNKLTSDGKSVLTEAIQNGSEEIFWLLLRYNANLNDAVALNQAVRSNNIRFLGFMFDCGAEMMLFVMSLPNLFTTETRTLFLQGAIAGRRTRALEYLIENGLDIRMHQYETNKCNLVTVLEKRQLCEVEPEFASHKDSYDEILRIILKEISVYVITDPDYFDEAIIDFIRHDNFMKFYFKKYVKQIRLMATMQIRKNSKLRYADLLNTSSVSSLNSIDEEILATISKDEIKVFPDFAERMMRMIRKALLPKAAKEITKQILYDIFKTKLSFKLISYICNFFDTKYLLVFAIPELDKRNQY